MDIDGIVLALSSSRTSKDTNSIGDLNGRP